MSQSALAPANPSAELQFKARVDAALARITPSAAYQALIAADVACHSYALISTGIKLVSVMPHKVENKSIERTCMGEGLGVYFNWLEVPHEALRYDADALNSGLFGPIANNHLCDNKFDLVRTDIDLCNVFLALSQGMYELQELPALQKLQQQLGPNKPEGNKPAQVFVALAARLPEAPSMQPYTAEIVLAVSDTGKPDLPLFNLGKVKIVVSNYRGATPASRVESHMQKVTYISAP